MEYYLDIETTGLDPFRDEIITIQYQSINKNTGEAIGPLTILKEWEHGEQKIVQMLFSIFKKWEFVPVGMNLAFELKFLTRKFAQYCGDVDYEYYYQHMPFIDLKHVLILFNNGEFKGSGLDNFTLKKTSGKDVLQWYATLDYKAIEEYIQNETEAFLHFYQFLIKRMPEVAEEYRLCIGKETKIS